MFFQGPILGLLISTFLGTMVNGQDFLAPAPANGSETSGVISGAVLSSSGHPLPGVPVELQDANSLVVAKAETTAGGSFALYNIPRGYYEVTSLAGGSQARRFVDLSSGRSTVDLSFVDSARPPAPLDATISVAQITVPGNARRLYEKARDSVGKKDYGKARQFVDQALQRQPEFAEALTLRGFLERTSQQLDAAARDCEQALQVDPYYGLAYSTLASIYNLQGRYDDALRTLNEGVAVAPRAWQMYFEMAKASIAKGLFGKGLELMDTAERWGGYNYPEVHLVRAYALVPLKFYGEARSEVQAFLSRQPSGANAQRARQLLASLDGVDGQGSALIRVAAK